MRLWMCVLLCFLAVACKKQVPALEIGNVVRFGISGFTVGDSLEFWNEGNIMATVGGTFAIDELIAVPVTGQGIIEIRKQGSTQVIATRYVATTPFLQTTSIFHDNGKIYDKSVKLELKGYAMIDSLELLLDGTVITSGIENKFTPFVNIGAEEGMQRELQIRNKKNGNVLSVRKITATTAVQKIFFYYDGKDLIDKVNLAPPANPAYMNVTVKLEPSLPEFFTGMPVDLVFYKQDLSKGLDAVVKADIKISLSGDFGEPVTLPPLPDNFRYVGRLCRTGTELAPYDTTKDLLPIRNLGTNTNFVFSPGKSQLWIIKDVKSRRPNGPSKGTIFTLNYTDLSQYFQ
ncbi:hypothetical protein [Chitinophaga nivalis]|uniref:Uncharacterized protein n=1 Tax=Chitinophaga nivalis TaxID=2991709 RepID=A0ABT3IES4_9BACT|nr:hypothetical protein [Chitinophaga nivalis]MCW3467850.1 hypothetical protein [Chitinophaga nivalis]MCW3482458.1 hypothetical protein [Chitinophaga nivalis]